MEQDQQHEHCFGVFFALLRSSGLYQSELYCGQGTLADLYWGKSLTKGLTFADQTD